MFQKFKLLNTTFYLVSIFLLLSLTACSETQVVIEKKLDHVLQDDLKWIVAEIMRGSGASGLLDKPYYVLEELKYFQGDTARVFAAYAHVKFYYYRDLNLIQERKYRYNTQRKFWDRYHKKLLHEAPKD